MTDAAAQQRHRTRNRRVARAMVAVLAVAGVAYWCWGLWQESLLNAQVEQYRRDAGGGPVLFAEFNRGTGVPDAENAAADLRAAVKRVDADPADWGAVDNLWPHLPLDEGERKALRVSLAAYAPALARVDVAVTKRGVDWHLRYAGAPLDLLLPDLPGQRELASLLGAAALEAHDRGDDRAAVARVRELLFVARAVDQQYAEVAHLVSVGLTTYGSVIVGEIVPELRVEGGEASGGGVAASREQVRGLIGDLLDEGAYRSGGVRAMVGKRGFDLETLVWFASNPPSSPENPHPGAVARFMWRLVRPMVYLPARRLAAYETGFVAAIGRADWDAAHAAEPVAPRSYGVGPGALLAEFSPAGIDRELKTHFAGMESRRTAAAAVAARWYAADHGGRWPAALAELVPAYLPAVPADPMDGGRPVRLVADHAGGPVVYGVGIDATDDGGSEATRRPEDRGDPSQMADFVLHLTRQPRPPKPATQALEDLSY